MSLVGWIKGTSEHGFGYDSTAEQVTRGLELSGKRILITGCNSGIGLESARVLSLRGATVLGAARTREKAETAMADFATPGVALACDLSEPDSVRACVEEVRDQVGPVHAIIANAGIMALPKRTEKYGVELQLFTNHIGHFILITGLVERLTENGRVVVVSSRAHRRARGIRFDDLGFERGYSAFRAYGQSKLANLLFARALARRFDDSKRVAMALHPGVIATNLGRHMNAIMRGGFAAIGPLFLKSVEQGAATQVFAAVHPAAAAYNGEYLSDCQPTRSTAAGRDVELAERLWRVTEDLAATL